MALKNGEGFEAPAQHRGGGGVLTLTWYTYMCLPVGVLFRKIWYSDQGVFIRDEGAQITQIGCILGKLL